MTARKIMAAALCSVLVFATFPVSPAMADPASPQPEIQAAASQDAGMSCEKINEEMTKMNAIVNESAETQRVARKTGLGAGIAQTAGLHLLGGLGGAIGLVGAAAVSVASGSASQEAEIEAEQAQMRYASLAGVHAAKGCAAADIAPAAGAPEDSNTEAATKDDKISTPAATAQPVRKRAVQVGND